MPKTPVLALTMGDPAGVGPEIVAALLAKGGAPAGCRLVIVGAPGVLAQAGKLRGLKAMPRVIGHDELTTCDDRAVFLDGGDEEVGPRFARGVADGRCGKAAYDWIMRACHLAKTGVVSGIVTAPVCKEAINLAGIDFTGHTELIARCSGTDVFAMLQSSPALSVVFATTHIPLKGVSAALTGERLLEVFGLAEEFLRRMGAKRRRIAVCGLNPHSGEGGYMGREEVEVIIPAIKKAQDAGMDIEGPHPSDTMFLETKRKSYDVAVAMYHDQGHIPFKMVAFSHGVNVTLGLPFVRTSVDHGTAFDIAWRGVAEERSLCAAVGLAARLSRRTGDGNV